MNGQAIEDFKNELLAAVPETSKVALVTGIINRSGTMPLPSGYTREQCKYCAWLDRIDGSSSANFHCSIDQSSGTIVGHVSNGNIPGSYAVIFGYLCIAVK